MASGVRGSRPEAMLQYAIGPRDTAGCLLSRLDAEFLQSFIGFGRVSPEIIVLWSGRWRCALFERKSKYYGISNLITPACKGCSAFGRTCLRYSALHHS